LDKLPVVYHGRGCSKCRFTGYQGRTAIAELLLLSEDIREMTISRRHANEIDAQARREGMTSLFLSGVDKVHQGMLGYVWMQGKFNPASNLRLQSQTVRLMIIWFFVCLTGLIGPIANTAHAVGAVMGIAWGYITARLTKIRQRR
jgi:hypothetical protein